MNTAQTMFLDEDKKVMWAQAGANFPGEQLHQVIQRTVQDLPINRDPTAFYELRRWDVPRGFDELKKLQATGAARWHIETEGDDFREVLRVEVTLLDAIMMALALLLDVLLNTLGGSAGNGGDAGLPPLIDKPAAKPAAYVPSWKRHGLIEHDGPSR